MPNQRINNIAEISNPQAEDELLIWVQAVDGTRKIAYKNLSNISSVKGFGAVGDGVTDDSAAIQNAIDANEGSALFFHAGTYIIKNTIYLGNVDITGEGRNNTTLKIVSDAGWTQAGSASKRTEACIISKATASAGYGISAVDFTMKDISIEFTNTGDAQSVQTAVLIEQWHGGGLLNVSVIAVSATNTNSCTPFDIYKDCQDLVITNCLFDNRDTLAIAGGFWIRGRDGGVTKNISYRGCQFFNVTSDECVAVWGSSSSGGVVKNISFIDCYFESDGSAFPTAGGIWFRNPNDLDVNEFSASMLNCRIVVDNLKLSAGAGILCDGFPLTANDVQVTIKGVDASCVVADCYRSSSATTPETHPNLNNCTAIIDGIPTVDIVQAYKGTWNLTNCTSRGLSSGTFNTVLKDISGSVIGGEFRGANQVGASNCNRLDGVELYSKVVNSYDIRNSYIEIDTDVLVAATVIDNTALVRDKLTLTNLTIQQVGTGLLTRIFNISTSPKSGEIDNILIEGGVTPLGSLSADVIPPFTRYTNVLLDDGVSQISLSREVALYGGSSADIQTAIDSLTPGRTWKEKIVLHGEFDSTTSISVPSYTVIELNGLINVNLNSNIFTLDGVTDVDIKGGTYTMPGAGGASSQHMVSITNASARFTISDVTVSGSQGHAIDIKGGSHHGIIHECILDDYGDDGISVVASNNIQIIGNICSNGRSETGGSSGIEIEDTSFNITIIGNTCFGQPRGIQTVVDTGINLPGNYDITISGNIVYDNTSAGIICQYSGIHAIVSSNHTIVGNICTNNGVGILTSGSNGMLINSNVINGTTAIPASGNGHGIQIGNGDRVIVSGNTVTGARGNGINFTGNLIVIKDNQISNCGQDGTANYVYGIRAASTTFNARITGNSLSDNQLVETMAGINLFDADTAIVDNNHFSNLANLTGPGLNAIYEQSSNGPVSMSNNTHDAGDTVTFVTEVSAQITGTSPLVLTHGLVGGSSSDAYVSGASMDSGVTNFNVQINATDLTVRWGDGGTHKFTVTGSTKNV